MKILRELLAAYQDRTAAYRERTVAFGVPPAKSEAVEDEAPAEDHPTDPFQAWMQDAYEGLSDSEVYEILWARGRLKGTEEDGTEDEARAILTAHAVPGSMWK